MKPLIALLALSSLGIAASGLQSSPVTSDLLPPLPSLISLGLGLIGGPASKPIVGACECHSPLQC